MHTTADFLLADGTFAYTGQTGPITPRLSTTEDGNDVVYEAVVIPTLSSGEVRTIVFDIPGVGRYTHDIPAATMFASGKIHHFGAAVSPRGVVVTTGEIEDWTGKEDPVETGSADPVVSEDPEPEMLLLPNCYMVKPGNTVRIPVSKAYAMWAFDPLLKEAGATMNGTVTVKKVWEDTKGLMPAANITLEGTGLNAEIVVVAGDAILDGNVSVGLYIDDVIFWSWHVWITNYDPSLTASQVTNNGFTFMDRNLGSWENIANPAQQGKRVGHTYQWGRKDPLFPLSPYMAGQQAVVNNEGTNIGLGTRYGDVSGDAMNNLVWSIRNPITIIRGSGAIVDWYSAEGEEGANRWNNPDGTKSAFDPCPAGWRVPVSGAGNLSPWYGISTADGSWNNVNSCRGWTFSNLGYFPAGGYFTSSGMAPTGALIGNAVFLWTATQSSEDGYAYCLRADSSSWIPSSTLARGSSMPVRCVKE
jgi:hypothetical protein